MTENDLILCPECKSYKAERIKRSYDTLDDQFSRYFKEQTEYKCINCGYEFESEEK